MKNGLDLPVELCIVPLGGGLDQVSLTTVLKEKNPDAHFLFVTSVPFDNMIPILLELGLPLQLIQSGCDNLLASIQTAASKLFSGHFWGIGQYLARGTQVHSLKIRNTGARMAEASPLFDFARKIGIPDHMHHTLANVTDELLMNAMFDAPRDKDGAHKFAALPRAEAFKLNELESPVLEFGSDGHHLAVSVTDPFGGLNVSTVLAYLEKCLFSNENQIDKKAGGAGLGLFQIYKAVDRLVFNIEPGRRCEVICLMKLKLDAKFSKRTIEMLSYFERKTPSEQS